jgi:hypothetical protein
VLGTGAFTFVSHVKGQSWEGKRFDGYFRPGYPHLDGFKAFFIKGSALATGIAGGQFDIEFRGVTPSERDSMVAQMKDNAVVLEGPWVTSLIVTLTLSVLALLYRVPGIADNPISRTRFLIDFGFVVLAAVTLDAAWARRSQRAAADSSGSGARTERTGRWVSGLALAAIALLAGPDVDDLLRAAHAATAPASAIAATTRVRLSIRSISSIPKTKGLHPDSGATRLLRG